MRINLLHEDIAELLEETPHQRVWDFATALGDTILEKYESLYCEMVHAKQELINRGGVKGYFWMVTSPEVSSIFETATAGWYPISEKEIREQIQYFPQNTVQLLYCGVINKIWQVYKDPALLPPTQILMGAGFTKDKAANYVKITIKNFFQS